ncbi:Short-chain dehydorgenase/reductase [Frankia canadensis]|uniref:Short-chain dehydorgenase/reductase n=1 Tax=Frankia canadensis TaxID=1836972 RepID=A0A2I2KJD8_9ACTN|nr:SDR family oxidoreductase [Frankia canadensis]SNQ45767.1 Short-chain dehydorgenase/reductase [Frankia canadensis]SOU53057.1 Short-chain dehydorgenase/reductase [Frankia canadensis]
MPGALGAQRTAVVVGTGPDIGRACAVAVAADGAHVVCFDRDESAAEASAEAVAAAGGTATSAVVDVTDRAAVREALTKVASEHGHVDVLVNVVGGSDWSLAAETSDEEWDRSFVLNLRQQWVVAQEALKVMTAERGAIVAIASVSGLTASTRHGAYGAAKAGLISLVRTLAIENAGRGIRVNAVAPGTIATAAREGDDHLAARIPLGRRGRSADIAAAAAFLASDKADYITGQVLVVDGGVGVRHSLIDL